MAQAAISQDLHTERWQARALELAERRHLTGVAPQIGTTAVGGRIYKVPSRSSDGRHVVIYFPAIDKYTCDCPSGIWGKACSHVGAALDAEHARETAERDTSPSQEWRWWANTHD